MGKSLYATVSRITLEVSPPSKKERPGVMFKIETYGLTSSTNIVFNFKLSRKFFNKHVAVLPEHHRRGARDKILRDDEIRKEFLDEINTNLYPKSSVHVVFSKLKTYGMIEFMNEIGDQGWDTSGQLPFTDGGPTYVTMMRKRIS